MTQPHPLCTKPEPHGAHAFMSRPRAIDCPGTPPAIDANARPRRVTSDRVVEALIIGGVIADDLGDVRRVIIDLKSGHIPIIHVEKLADERLLAIVRTLDDVRIERAPLNRPVGFAARSAIVERRQGGPVHAPQSTPGRRFPPEVTA